MPHIFSPFSTDLGALSPASPLLRQPGVGDREPAILGSMEYCTLSGPLTPCVDSSTHDPLCRNVESSSSDGGLKSELVRLGEVVVPLLGTPARSV